MFNDKLPKKEKLFMNMYVHDLGCSEFATVFVCSRSGTPDSEGFWA
jgi:hypothetical protein